MDTPDVVAAGAVVSQPGPRVLLVHRPKYDDWSFPKGKLDPGEHMLGAAVREVEEETGLTVRLGPPLSDQHYQTGDSRSRHKVVHYWVARPVGDPDLSTYATNSEIDALAWVPVEEACEQLTYPHDRDTLAEYLAVRRRSTPLIVLRHGEAHGRSLTAAGREQAESLVPMLAAYGVQRILSSSRRRCWSTLSPFSEAHDVDLEVTDVLREGASRKQVPLVVEDLMRSRVPTVLCADATVTGVVMRALGLPARPLDTAEMLVAHHRRAEVVAIELHRP